MSILPTEQRSHFCIEELMEDFSQYVLTADQLLALEKLISFLNSDENIFMLKGFAGTGKTFILRGLCKFLSKQHIPVYALAPTGKAARVLESKVGFGQTIHAAIYNKPEVVRLGTDKTKKDIYKLKFNLKSNQTLSFDAVFIVDEASMLSDQYSDSNVYLFGTGKLLQDFLSFVEFKAAPRRKIIFVGDSAQLPPVGMSFSPAFSAEYLHKNYGCLASEVLLQEVVRQKKQSTILKNAYRLRSQIDKKRFSNITLDLTQPDCWEITANEVASSYLDYCKRLGNGFSKTCIITYSNYLAEKYNLQVRAIRFPDCRFMQKNDLLIVMVNNHLFDLNNGDFIVVKQILQEHYCFNSFYNKKNLTTGKIEHIPVELYFTYAEVIYKYSNGSNQQKKVWINENLLYSYNSNDNELEEHVRQCLYINAIKRFKEKEPLKNINDFDSKIEYEHYKSNRRIILNRFLIDDPFLNALQVKFGYAITCHKSQGSEWVRVYVDCNYGSTRLLNENYFRWLYTAITRAKQELVVINPPSITMGSAVKFSGFDLVNPTEVKKISDLYTTVLQHSKKVEPIRESYLVPNLHKQQDVIDDLETRSEIYSAFVTTNGVIASDGPKDEFEQLEVDVDSFNLEEKSDHIINSDPDYISSLNPAGVRGVGSYPAESNTVNEKNNIKIESDTFVDNYEITINTKPVNRGDFFIQLIYKTLHSFIVSSIEISDFPYLKRCFITISNEKLQYDMYYSGKNELTRILNKCQPLTPLSIQIYKLLKSLEGVNIFDPYKSQIDVESQVDPELQEIIRKLREAFVKHKLEIVKLSLGQYMLDYILQSNEEKGEIIVRYNGKYAISSCVSVRRKGHPPMSTTLAAKIQTAVRSLR